MLYILEDTLKANCFSQGIFWLSISIIKSQAFAQLKRGSFINSLSSTDKVHVNQQISMIFHHSTDLSYTLVAPTLIFYSLASYFTLLVCLSSRLPAIFHLHLMAMAPM